MRSMDSFDIIAQVEREARERFGEHFDTITVQSTNHPTIERSAPEEARGTFWDMCRCNGTRCGCYTCTEGADPPRHLQGKGLWRWLERLSELRVALRKKQG